LEVDRENPVDSASRWRPRLSAREDRDTSVFSEQFQERVKRGGALITAKRIQLVEVRNGALEPRFTEDQLQRLMNVLPCVESLEQINEEQPRPNASSCELCGLALPRGVRALEIEAQRLTTFPGPRGRSG